MLHTHIRYSHHQGLVHKLLRLQCQGTQPNPTHIIINGESQVNGEEVGMTICPVQPFPLPITIFPHDLFITQIMEAQIPLKCQSIFNRLHGATSQKIPVLIFVFQDTSQPRNMFRGKDFLLRYSKDQLKWGSSGLPQSYKNWSYNISIKWNTDYKNHTENKYKSFRHNSLITLIHRCQ
jgi:hypothetical protein